MMKNLVFKYIKILTIILALFNFLMFLSMRCCWSGISKTLGYENGYKPIILHLPLIVFFVLALTAITNIVLYKVMKKDKNIWSIIMLGIDFIFLIAIIVIIKLGAIDYMYFIMPEFVKASIITAIIFLIMLFIFIYPKTRLAQNNKFKYSLFLSIVILAVIYTLNLSINRIEYEPVVYAVDDNYQIVFGTSSEALGWVEIDGKRYLDTNAGSEKSYTKVHKIEIPMEVLDNAKAYSIYTQRFFYRGPFGAIKGKVISKDYNFKPVDTSDGINYYALSDIHMEIEGSVQAINYNQDKEFLVLAGDIISMIETHDDAFYTGKVAFELTKGEIPVVYARGNHEIKGKYSEEFYKYVGSKHTNFYFNFYLGNIYGMVLDLGEDHDDDYWEYYGTADYDAYRLEQVEFIKNELQTKNYENYDYKMIVSHIPINYINGRKNHVPIKEELNGLINQMNIDILLSGHQHDLWAFEPNAVTPNQPLTINPDYGTGKEKGYVLDHNYPVFLISKRGLTQNDSAKLTQKTQIGLTVKVDFTNNTQTVTYNNSLGNKVMMVNPFANYTYGEDIVINLTTKEFKKQ